MLEKKIDICFIGGIIMDMTSYMDAFPKPGETKVGHRFEAGYGGKAANQAALAAKLGAKCAMVARVGDDANGRSYIDHFRSLGINVNNIRTSDKSSTGAANIWVDDSGMNCICVILGANLDMTKQDILDAEDTIAASAAVVIGLELDIDIAHFAIQIAGKHKVQCLLNAAPMPKDMHEDFFCIPDVFNVNESEASIATGIAVTDAESAKLAARHLVEKKHCKTVIITLGENGAVFGSNDGAQFVHVPTDPVKAVDTTGAGDAFCGALAFFWAKYPDLPVETIVKKCCDVATMSVLKPGTQASFPSREELPEGFIPA
ncbi:unnamed protein product [Notodromas monacha]|nr:unnamed protein product [Notodromas monacha]CAG0917295.1 unnamed protein product [Notodromas monacha]